MAKLTAGQNMPDFTFHTAFEEGKTLYGELSGKTFVWFLRYYGCTLCQVDLHALKTNYDKFTEKGARVIVVMQSAPSVIAAEIAQGDLPFEIVCDETMALYKRFEILPAKSKLGMASLAIVGKAKQAKELGFEHGAYEGDELQLPALFLLDREGKIEYAHYGKNVTDIPSIPEMLGML